MRTNRCSAVLAMAAALFTLPAAAQQTVNTNQMTNLRATPDDSGTLIRVLAGMTPVQTLQRRGAWTQVRVGNDTGWVRMMHLRGGATVVEGEASSNSGFLAGFQRLLAPEGRGNYRAQGATLGIRGFSKEDVAKAEFNSAEFEKLKRFQASSGEAARFGQQGSLAFRSVAYLAQDAIDMQGKGGAK